MYYAIISEDKPGTLEQRLSNREQHLARLKELKNQGRLLIAGPHPTIDCETPGSAGFSGSLVVAEFDCLEDAKNWASLDPFVTCGVYDKFTVKPYIKVLP